MGGGPNDSGPIARVGFIGLGDMGGAMAARIVAGGYPLVLWARRPEALEAFAGPHVTSASSPTELAAAVDLVGVCVWADDDVRSVVLGEGGVLAGCRPGTIIAIHSTVLPETCRELEAAAAERDVVVVDAPVSGGRQVAEKGELVVAVGGDEAAYERCRPVFATFGEPVLHLGPLGSAQLAKLVNNSMLAANFAIADDALTLGVRYGIAPDAMAAVLRNGSGRSYALDVALGSRSSADIRSALRGFLEKDVAVLQDAASTERPSMPQLADASLEAVRRLGDPPDGWAR